MSNLDKQIPSKEEVPGQNKEFSFTVNGREKTWADKKISYDQLVVIAFGSISNDPNVYYTITFKKGENNKPEGTLVKGDDVRLKDGMRFNVTQTNRS
jgi:hypothetical protein